MKQLRRSIGICFILGARFDDATVTVSMSQLLVRLSLVGQLLGKPTPVVGGGPGRLSDGSDAVSEGADAAATPASARGGGEPLYWSAAG